MNLSEFAALKAGDRITGMNGDLGHVTEVNATGVKIAWGSPTALPFAYSVNSTIWMHWSKAEDETQ